MVCRTGKTFRARISTLIVIVVLGLVWRKESVIIFEVIRYGHHPTLTLFSAHERTLNDDVVVTVVGIGNRDHITSTHVTCRLTVGKEKTGSGNRSVFWDTQGNVSILPGHHDERYGAILIDCPLLPGPVRPSFASVVLSSTDPDLYTVRITSPKPGPPMRQMALCVPPIYGGYNSWKELIETLELLQLLGVDHAEMYILDVGPNVTSVLNYYASSGFLRLHTWPDPPQPVHYFGQLAAVNDCLLRMRNVAKLVMFTDLDEIILPHHHESFSDMLQGALKEQQDPDQIGAFNFLNAFFESASNSEASVDSLQLNSILSAQQLFLANSLGLRTVSRLLHRKIFNYQDRSKCIVDPLKVTRMEIHFVGNFSKGFRSVTVDPSISLMHHYRVKEDKESPLVQETSALKYTARLIKRVQNVWAALGVKIPVGGQHADQEGTNPNLFCSFLQFVWSSKCGVYVCVCFSLFAICGLSRGRFKM